MSRTSNINDLNHEFVSWPSMKEVQSHFSEFPQRLQKPKAHFADGHISKSPSPHPSCTKTEDFEVCISYFHIEISHAMHQKKTI